MLKYICIKSYFFICVINFITIYNYIIRTPHKLKYFIGMSYSDSKHIYNPIFIGGQKKVDVRYVWTWTDGSKWDYENWNSVDQSETEDYKDRDR